MIHPRLLQALLGLEKYFKKSGACTMGPPKGKPCQGCVGASIRYATYSQREAFFNT